jgi:calcineurin-like phosphoesterase family protein
MAPPLNFFTSDLHLGHTNILKHQPSRAVAFGDIDTMDYVLIDRINQTVGRDDILWILGDFAWKASKYGHYRQRIIARQIHIVTGNHDTHSLRNYVSSMNDMVYRRFDGIKVHMTHYPMLSWRGRNHGSIHLYAHCHATVEGRVRGRSMDVGVDNARRLLGEWRPFAFTEILELLDVDPGNS